MLTWHDEFSCFKEPYKVYDRGHSRGDQWRATSWMSRRGAEEDFCYSVC